YMIERALYNIAFSEECGRQMRFITGTRQSGKTTFAKLKLKRENLKESYYLWDLRRVRERYKDNELFFTADNPPLVRKSWVCFDEIHKMPKWKNILKGIYDSSFESYNFIITGSAKFDISKRAGDSLAGRYFTFHLFPLCLNELVKAGDFPIPVSITAEDFIKQRISRDINAQEELKLLLEYSGFPEPFTMQSKRFQTKWSQDYLDAVVKEDIGALTRIIDKEYLYDLYKLLPAMTGSPISESSLASHLEISPPTIKNYLKRLEDFYLAFRVHPYSKNIKRSLLKASKCYLYDWTLVKDMGKRFENYTAVELKTRINLWNDATGSNFSLFYIRNKEKQEVDFLITQDEKPWLLVETKSSDSTIAKHCFDLQKMLGDIPLVQLCMEDNICMLQNKNSYRVSASRFLA
ncbi:MAG: ATP-binding protein, partial [Candidatus Omnitrophota bacterium]|nr:ATP-binding protein [Candidatus Omnitrophota bacterium]